MRTASLAEWLSSPETRALVTYLKFRQAERMVEFLKGLPVAPADQGRVAGFNEVERLLEQPPERIIEVFNNAARELNEQRRRP